MRCHNEKCGRQFTNALELFDGSLVCPHCFQSVKPGEGDFHISEKNEEWYALSESYFFSYLQSVNPDEENKGKDKNKPDKDYLLANALKYCEKAAVSGHPEAMVMLGFFYYKNYVNYDLGGLGRYKTAYLYLTSIIDHNNRDDILKAYSRYYKETESGNETAKAEKKVSVMLKKAAFYLADMIMYAPVSLTKESKDNKYSKSHVKEFLAKETDSTISVPDMSVDVSEDNVDLLSNLKSIFELCKQTSVAHSPLFGYYSINEDEYHKLVEIYKEYKGGSLDVGLVWKDEDDNYKYFAFDNTAAVENLKLLKDGKCKMYFFFLNGNCAGFVKKDTSANEIFDYLTSKRSEIAYIIKNTAGCTDGDHILSWDDGYFVKHYILRKNKGKKVSEGIVNLILGEYKI